MSNIYNLLLFLITCSNSYLHVLMACFMDDISIIMYYMWKWFNYCQSASQVMLMFLPCPYVNAIHASSCTYALINVCHASSGIKWLFVIFLCHNLPMSVLSSYHKHDLGDYVVYETCLFGKYDSCLFDNMIMNVISRDVKFLCHVIKPNISDCCCI